MMKKTKKILSVLTCLLLALSLTGCMAVVMDVNVGADDSGTVRVRSGYTKETMEQIKALEEDGESGKDETYTEFTYNGNTYYAPEGGIEEKTFRSIEELNALLNSDGTKGNAEMQEQQGGADAAYRFSKNTDGSLLLEIDATEKESSEDAKENEYGMSEEELQAMSEDMVVVTEFSLPAAVTQLSGGKAGVTIDGKKLSLDLMKMESGKYRFTTSSDPAVLAGLRTPSFPDVKDGDWYYQAVCEMFKGGLVRGYDDGTFLPLKELTYAEFCTILANAKQIATGTENGYWAYKAIDACVKAGYIADRGGITPENYNVPITREAAVAGMYRVAKDTLSAKGSFTAQSIPDYDKIGADYAQDIVSAYNYGITTGMDAQHTFAPQGKLNRAQVCQLFFNVGMTQAKAS